MVPLGRPAVQEQLVQQEQLVVLVQLGQQEQLV